jgi:hypothetical protein
MQFDSNFVRLVTKSEPGAVAIGQGPNGKMDAKQGKCFEEIEYSAGRYHHPRGLPARGTPGSLPVLILYWLARPVHGR